MYVSTVYHLLIAMLKLVFCARWLFAPTTLGVRYVPGVHLHASCLRNSSTSVLPLRSTYTRLTTPWYACWYATSASVSTPMRLCVAADRKSSATDRYAHVLPVPAS